MGMNLYTLKKEGRKHIGKRYANGFWCWDCKVKAERDIVGLFWFCPKCGQRCSDKTLSYNPAMREFGFDKSEPHKKKGVDGASGFIWCIDNNTGLGKNYKKSLKNISKIRTEYGEYWSIKKFWQMFDDIIEESESDNDFC